MAALQSLKLTCKAPCGRRLFSSHRSVKELDVLYLRQGGKKGPKWHLTKPLKHGNDVKLSAGGRIAASDLIGKRLLDVVKDSKGHKVVVHEPSMSKYILNAERLATPIYPHDANSMVALLDLNLPRPGEDEDFDNDPLPFEIFEAGTGMGSLTLHIARALHAANPAIPRDLRSALTDANLTRREDQALLQPDLPEEEQAALDAYRSSRRAVLHTLDNRNAHARAAYKMVRNFHRAMYLPTIDFHARSISDFITARLEKSGGQPFLSRAVLDLPAAEDYADPVVRAMHRNGILLLFCPSISQVAEFCAWARQAHHPLQLEKVMELANTTISDSMHDSGGGREWSVKVVPPRKSDDPTKMVQVMRPKVGDRVGGGGFVAIFRRMPDEHFSSNDVLEVEDPEVAEETERTEGVEESENSDSSEVGEPGPSRA